MSEDDDDLDLGDEGDQSDDEDLLDDDDPDQLIALTKKDAGAALSILGKTGNGMRHAYLKMNLADKRLLDISEISSFVHIRYLNLSNNYLTTLGPLSDLVNLLSIRADHNKLTRIDLGVLPFLQILNVSYNKITSIDDLTQPQLEILNANYNNIVELGNIPREALPEIQALEVRRNKINTLENFSCLSLKKLYIAENRLSKLPLVDFPFLEIVHARNNKIETLEGMRNLPNLKYLNIRENEIQEPELLDALTECHNLTHVIVSNNPVSMIDTYRLEVIMRCVKVTKIDKEEVELDEKRDAQELQERIDKERVRRFSDDDFVDE